MPELPEVETTRLGLSPWLVGERVNKVSVFNPNLRYKVPDLLKDKLQDQLLEEIIRRGKYLLFKANKGFMIIHLGMSGSLRLVKKGAVLEKHDHLEIIFDNDQVLRYRDPRRFGLVLWTDKNPNEHKCLVNLGLEPLTNEFSGQYLYDLSRNRCVSVKSFIMNSKIVVGVGNIYACESLFAAGINPARRAGLISRNRYDLLVEVIKTILRQAIARGGTTLQDFIQTNGQPGYFQQRLNVYGREGKPCATCQRIITKIVLGQRSSFYCRNCQT